MGKTNFAILVLMALICLFPSHGYSAAPQPDGSFGKKYEHLIPADSTLAEYDPKRFSVISGKVVCTGATMFSGVKITILDKPEYGSVLTDDQGKFLLPVEGGGNLTIVYQKEGLVKSHRQVRVPWNDIVVAEVVKLLALEQTTLVEKKFLKLSASDDKNGSTITYRSRETKNNAGSRACTVVLKDNTNSYALSKGQRTPIATGTPQISAVEYATPEAMPARLPPNSAFTYCVELAVNGEERTEFDAPVAIWVENFLGFEVGESVPAGHYDRDKAHWVPSENGVVVRLLDTNSDGITDSLDADGDGLPDDLNGDGSHIDEVEGLDDPQYYPPGATFWRTLVSHFSPWDFNWPYGPPKGAMGANPEGTPYLSSPEPETTGAEDCDSRGSIIKDRRGILHQDLAIPGTELYLHYTSQGTRGYTYRISVPASGSSVPISLKGIDVKVEVAGRVLEPADRLPPLPHQIVDFNWNGLDVIGEPISAPTTATISVGFVYDAVYYASAKELVESFGQFGEGITAISNIKDGEITAWSHSEKTIYPHARPMAIAAGWTISNHHFLVTPEHPVVIRGDGSQEMGYPHTVKDFAGTGEAGYSGDEGPAISSQLHGPEDTIIDAEGNVFIADTGNHRIRKIDRHKIIDTTAGTGTPGYSGDNGPAGYAQLNNPARLSFDNSGSMYIADRGNHCIRRIDPKGIITTIAGTGTAGYSGDNGPASDALLNSPTGVTADAFGNIYIADSGNGRVRKIDPGGTITTIAGTGDWCRDRNDLFQPLPGFLSVFMGRFNNGWPPSIQENGDEAFAAQAPLNYPVAVAVDGDGTIYIADKGYRKIRRINVNGIISSVGNVFMATGMDVDSEGNLLVSERHGRISKVFPESDIQSSIAGMGSAEGGAAVNTKIYNPSDVGSAVNNRKAYLISEPYKNRIRQVAGAMDSLGVEGDEIIISGKEGLRYVFGQNGQHLRTTDLHTGVVLFTFTYDEKNRLVAVTDRFDNQTTIQRNAYGVPEAIISPDGVTVLLDVDVHNQLYRITYPNSPSQNIYQFEYENNDGLMTAKIEPEGYRFKYGFDAVGRLNHYTDEEGGSWSFSRNMAANGNITSEKLSAEGNLTRYVDHTDITGAFTSSIQAPAGDITLYNRSADKLSVEKSLPCGTKLTFNYQLDSEYTLPFLHEKFVSTPSGRELIHRWERNYQHLDNDSIPDILTETSIFSGNSTTLVTNFQTAHKVLTSPQGRVVTTSYDPDTLLESVTSVSGLYDTTYEYYPAGHQHYGKLRYIRTNTRETEFTYDASGNLYTVEEPEGYTTTYEEYDQVGRLKTVLRADGTRLRFEYDKNGNMITLTNPSAIDHVFGYDRVNLNDSYQTPLSGNYVYRYDADRRLVQKNFPSGRSIILDYVNPSDPADKSLLRQVRTPDGNIDYTYCCGTKIESLTKGNEAITYGYDGRLLTSEALAGTLNQSIAYHYNADGDFNPDGITYAGGTADFAYDNDELLTESGAYTITRNAGNGLPEAVNGGSLSLSRSFSPYGELDGQNFVVNGASLNAWALTRDNNGRIETKTETVGGVTTSHVYAYDAMGRLTSVTKDSALVEEYDYANVPYGTCTHQVNTLRGITARTLSYNAEDHLLSTGTASYAYNPDGFLTTKTAGPDITTYDYSLKAELLQVDLPDGRTIEYTHDPLGRRVAKSVDGLVTAKYLWQGLTRLLAVYDAANSLVMRFAYADGRMPVAMTRGGSTYYLSYGPVGSLRVVADTSGNVVKKIDYDAFGNILNDTDPAFEVPFGFAGGLYDSDTGLVRFGYRDYDPDIGRWTAKDPILFDGGDTDLYGYVQNNPVNYIDPLGLRRGGVLIPIRNWIKKNSGPWDIFGPIIDNYVNIPTTPWQAAILILWPKEAGRGSSLYLPPPPDPAIPIDWSPYNPKYWNMPEDGEAFKQGPCE